jgi:glutathione-regulated potassium-efflux system ancillary protein KefF
MWVASVDLPTPPLGLATTITGIPTSEFDSGYVTGERAPVDIPDNQRSGERRAGASKNHCRPMKTPISQTPPRPLVIAAHPQLQHSRANRALMRAATQAGCDLRDLYALYPDYLIDIEAEQRALAAAQLVVWQHPIHWYSAPPLMKLWVDDVLSFGWAYGGMRGSGSAALRGKDLWLVASTGGTEESYRPDSYNRYFFDAFLPPFEQTAALLGMRFLPPLLLHGAHRANDAQIAEHAQVYADRLPDWPELETLEPSTACIVPETARPAVVA